VWQISPSSLVRAPLEENHAPGSTYGNSLVLDSSSAILSHSSSGEGNTLPIYTLLWSCPPSHSSHAETALPWISHFGVKHRPVLGPCAGVMSQLQEPVICFSRFKLLRTVVSLICFLGSITRQKSRSRELSLMPMLSFGRSGPRRVARIDAAEELSRKISLQWKEFRSHLRQ
jgi:hypothetical protein